jgi:hypothetical protein
MTELDLIRSFRADVPPAGQAATDRARRAWERPRRRRAIPRLALAGGLATAAIAAVLVLPGGPHGTEVAGAAPTLLRSAAAAQAGGVTRPLNEGEYWYVRRLTAWPASFEQEPRFTVIQPAYREEWIGADGSRGWRIRPAGERRFPTPQDRENWEKAGRPNPGNPGDQAVRPGHFFLGPDRMTYAQLLELPRDPQALYERLRKAAVDCRCGNGVDNETFVIAGDVLRDTPLPVDLRAAVLRATALIPGIELVGEVRDVAGREGIGVAFEGVTGRDVLVFDRESHALLGQNFDEGGSADFDSAIVQTPTATG